MDASPLRQRNFALLWSAGLIAVAGDWVLRIALPIYVLRLTGSLLATSAMVAASLAPVLLVGLVAGAYVDRWDRRMVMIVTRVAQGVLLLPLVFVEGTGRLWIVYAVAFTQSTLVQFFAPAENAMLPRLVKPEQLTAANSLNALNNNLGRLIGPAVGGVAAATLGLGQVAMINIGTFMVAAIMIALVRGSYTAARHRSTRLRHELAEGFGVIRRSRTIMAILGICAVTAVGEGVMGSLFAAFVIGPLDAGASVLSWLMSAQAVGGVFGGLAGARFAARIRPARLVAVSLISFGSVDLVIFNYPRWSTVLWPELAMFMLVGIPAVLGTAALMTLLQTQVADSHLGRVFSVALVIEAVFGILGAALAGTLGERIGIINMLTIQGLGYFLAGVAFALIIGWPLRGSRSAPAGAGADVVADRASTSDRSGATHAFVR